MISSISYIFIKKEFNDKTMGIKKYTTHTGLIWSIDCFENKMIFVENRENFYYLILFDFTLNKKKIIEKSYSIQLNPEIYNNKILYQSGLLTDQLNIFIYDISSEKSTQINSDSSRVISNPAIYENKIVWSDRRNDNPFNYDDEDALFLFDYVTKKEQEIFYSNSTKTDPDIYKNKVVWQDEIDDNFSIKLFDLNTEKLKDISNGGLDFDPRIWGNYIFYSQRDTKGNFDLIIYNIENNQEKRIPNSYNLYDYDIFKDKVVWSDENKRIYLYDISEEKLTKIIEVSDGKKVWNPTIWDDKIVFASNKDGDSSIYLYELKYTILGLEPPVFYFSMLIIIIILVIIFIHLRKKYKRIKQKEIKQSENKNDVKPEENIVTTMEIESDITNNNFSCPNCKKQFKFTEEKRPLRIKCPHCGVQGEIK